MKDQAAVDFKSLFESAPGLYLILSTDFTILTASDAYVDAIMTTRENITGKNIFEVFPDHPGAPSAESISNLYTSLKYVLKNKEAHTVSVQKFEIRGHDGKSEERFWSLLNKPVLNTDKEIIYIIHRVEDVTKHEKQEEKFRHLLDSMLEAVQIISFDWKYLYANDALVKQGGYSREELLGYTMMEKYPGLEQTEVFAALNKCMTERIPLHLETNFTFPDHSTTWFDLSIQPVSEGIMVLSVDISERKKIEEKTQKLNEELEQKVLERTAELENNLRQLRESEEKFQKAFQSSAAGIAITRLSDSTYHDVNDAFMRMTGFSKEELIGHASVELGIVMSLKKREEVLEQIRIHGSAKAFEVTIKNKSGQLLEVLSSAETIHWNGEKYAINLIYDITDRKKVEEQLEAVNKELEAFSYSVSHDLRAPLRAVDGYAKMLEDDYKHLFNEEGKRLLGVIQYNAKKMGQLIDDLLAFSRLGKKELQKTSINMNELVNGVIIDINKNGTHHAEIKIGKLHSVSADYSMLHLVLTNLVSNAIKYSSKKEKPVIEIHSEKKDREILFWIKDNGVGFDMQYAHKLFGVFQRLHKMEEFEGTGVGLAFIQRIILKHGGKVWADAKPNDGATFFFTLPIN